MTPPSTPIGSTLSAKGLTLSRRSELLWTLRAFFRAEGFLELEPPSVVRCPGMEPHLDAFEVIAQRAYLGAEGAAEPPPTRRWLHTSPEHALKRLLAEGFERVYAIGSCFRDEPASATHSPEFTMLEWYHKGATLETLMSQCERLINALAQRATQLLSAEVESAGAHVALKGMCEPTFERLSVREAFLRYARLDLTAHQTLPALQEASLALGLSRRAVMSAERWDELYFQLFLDLVEPQLGLARPVFLYDFPASQSALAKINPSDPRWALRFELFYQGVELANAFDELSDPVEQRARFESDLATRARLGSALYPMDEALLSALPALGQCVGIALGFDRLVMLLLNQTQLSAVLPQPWLGD